MGKDKTLLEQLEEHFKNTPKDILEMEDKELEYLNSIGPDVEDYYNSVNKYLKRKNNDK